MFRTVFLIVTLGTAGAAIGHFLVFGRKRGVMRSTADPKILRFSVSERLIHLVTVAGFLALACTGFAGPIGLGGRIEGSLWVAHVAMSPIFMAGLVAMVLIWAQDSRFERHDWQWAKCLGGYLQHNAHAPANRFNAGQKAFFWTVGALGLVSLASGLALVAPVFGAEVQAAAFTVHRYGMLAFVAAGIVHLYLTTAGNPGTLLSAVTGKVDANWAEHHHPVWAGDHTSDEASGEG